MKSYAKLTPEGMRDLPFESTFVERRVEGAIQRLFSAQGYREVHTPGLEYFDVFGATDRYFPQEELYKLTDLSGRLIVLRPESTLPIARMVSTKLANESLPLRMSYIQSTYRNIGKNHGEAHERRQAGVELIGAEEGAADLEILTLACQVFQRLGFEDFRLELGHVGIFQGLIEALPLEAEEIEALREAIGLKNYSLLKALLEPYGDYAEAQVLLELPRWFGSREEVEKRAQTLAELPGQVGHSFALLCELENQLTAMGYRDKVIFDLGLVASAGYYTGMMFRGYVGGAAGAVLSGGRYDNLFADFDFPVAATGFGIQVDVLAEILLERDHETMERVPLLFVENPELLTRAMQWRYRERVNCELSFSRTADEVQAECRQKGISGYYSFTRQGVAFKEVSL